MSAGAVAADGRELRRPNKLRIPLASDKTAAVVVIGSAIGASEQRVLGRRYELSNSPAQSTYQTAAVAVSPDTDHWTATTRRSPAVASQPLTAASTVGTDSARSLPVAANVLSRTTRGGVWGTCWIMARSPPRRWWSLRSPRTRGGRKSGRPEVVVRPSRPGTRSTRRGAPHETVPRRLAR